MNTDNGQALSVLFKLLLSYLKDIVIVVLLTALRSSLRAFFIAVLEIIE